MLWWLGATFVAAGLARTDSHTFTVPVQGGLRYQFRDLSAGGGVATVGARNAANGATGYTISDQ